MAFEKERFGVLRSPARQTAAEMPARDLRCEQLHGKDPASTRSVPCPNLAQSLGTIHC